MNVHRLQVYYIIQYTVQLSLLEESDSFKQPYLDKQNHLEGLAPGHTFWLSNNISKR